MSISTIENAPVHCPCPSYVPTCIVPQCAPDKRNKVLVDRRQAWGYGGWVCVLLWNSHIYNTDSFSDFLVLWCSGLQPCTVRYCLVTCMGDPPKCTHLSQLYTQLLMSLDRGWSPARTQEILASNKSHPNRRAVCGHLPSYWKVSVQWHTTR